MISALVLGELVADPVQRSTQAGKPFATVTIRAAAGAESAFMGLAAFNEPAVSKLLQLRKGDSVAATGTLETNHWTDRDGNDRSGWRMTVSNVLTAYEAGKRRKAAQEDRTRGRAPKPEWVPPNAEYLDA